MAKRTGIYQELLDSMPVMTGTSTLEQDILIAVTAQFPGMKIRNRARPKGGGRQLEIDIFFPDINKGIEVDGGYWHDVKLIKEGKCPDQKHKEKDDYFAKMGIRLLHIKEEKWRKFQKQ